MEQADASRVVAWRGLGVRVHGDAALLEEHLPPFYGGEGEVIAEARLVLNDGWLSVELPDDLSVAGPLGPETLRAAASRIELLISAKLPDRVAVHAGAVAWEGKAIVIPGLSMCGKSTLVRALVEAGATYLSDEFALLDDQGQVWPYPRRMTMRTATGTERHVPSPSADITGPGFPVAVVAALQFSAEGWAAATATQGETVMALVANSLPIRSAPARTIDSLTAVARGAVGLTGTRGEADDAAAHLLAML